MSAQFSTGVLHSVEIFGLRNLVPKPLNLQVNFEKVLLPIFLALLIPSAFASTITSAYNHLSIHKSLISDICLITSIHRHSLDLTLSLIRDLRLTSRHKPLLDPKPLDTHLSSFLARNPVTHIAIPGPLTFPPYHTNN